jgi:hypothetical protein
MNKTELQIMAEIERKGYASIEHGRIKRRTFGARIVNARNSLIQKGLIKVVWSTTETDSERGWSSVFYCSRVERA